MNLRLLGLAEGTDELQTLDWVQGKKDHLADLSVSCTHNNVLFITYWLVRLETGPLCWVPPILPHLLLLQDDGMQYRVNCRVAEQVIT